MSENNETKYNKIEAHPPKVTKEETTVEATPVKKETKQIVQTVQPKKNLFQRFTTGLLGPDGLKGIGRYVAEQILIPTAKQMLSDGLTTGINMAIYGEDVKTNTTRYSRPGYINYNKVGSGVVNRMTHSQPNNVVHPKLNNQIEEFLFATRNEAQMVLEELMRNAEMYTVATVADYYELIGQPSHFTYNNYGWSFEQLRGTALTNRGGYYALLLPNPLEVE